MRQVTLYGWVAMLVVAVGSAWAGPAEDAAALDQQGDKLLGQGDFHGAWQAYGKAAKADPENVEYGQQYAMLRQVLLMRKSLEKQQDVEAWHEMARALRAYYYENQVYGEALALDRQAHAKLHTPDSAVQLAETLLEVDLNDEAANVLSELADKAHTARSRALQGIALVRQGKLDEAKAVAGRIAVPDDEMPGTLYDVARVYALTGDTDNAAQMLVRCFERTRPSLLDGYKKYARSDKDLSALVARADFDKVMATKSKVKESGCSGGTSCGKCPSRSKCGHAAGTPLH